MTSCSANSRRRHGVARCSPSSNRGWHEVEPTDAVREAAVRFLRVHTLRAAGALQLAAAFIAAERRPSSLEVVTLDDRVAGAARKEGFVLIDARHQNRTSRSPDYF